MSKQILNPHSLLSQTIKRQIKLNKPQFQHLYRNYSSKFDNSTSTQIFTAPSARPIELVKKFSFATSVLGSVSVPLFYFCWDMPWVQESNLEYWSVVAAFLASVGSTSFLHWFCSPYVKKAYLDNSITETALNKGKTIEDCIMTPTTKLTLETSTIMGQTKINTLELKQLKPVINKVLDRFTK
ncbi:hypothetical protein CONCODRAFT_16314 [Conidiobolus coronatus NRRL 28638]|uniref:Uncharacterized protein n=1 Tax=Conidiobolus coronatus (strain ATCC 28846 / CBS 209.66 / NRRL 28638) TaxID=796925 RepID=A0A137PB70_CONC2|nr:hypothetical protein CONCODRAFT_16314 [Conidiobolus coronatus NRRL 28638]|eukprot:KXN72224.1 hypothetical protein CONCODRAFT_16314 [Conidiobolus coronatus NRRL 28638]